MYVTATELKSNMGKYLELLASEDIFITKNNKPVAKLTGLKQDKLSVLESLVGMVPDAGYTLEAAKAERTLRQ